MLSSTQSQAAVATFMKIQSGRRQRHSLFAAPFAAESACLGGCGEEFCADFHMTELKSALSLQYIVIRVAEEETWCSSHSAGKAESGSCFQNQFPVPDQAAE